MMRGFKIYKNKKGFYAAEFLSPEGLRICYRALGTQSRDEALLIADKMLRDGIPERKRGRQAKHKKPVLQSVEVVADLHSILKAIDKAELDAAGALQIAEKLRNRGLLVIPATDPKHNVDFITFLLNFYDYDKSPYVKEKLAHGQSIGRRYCKMQTNKIKQYWKPHFEGRKLASITRQELKSFFISLAEQGYSSYTLNAVMNAGTVPIGYAAREQLIPSNPAQGLKKFSNDKEKKRGCLLPEEAEKVFSHNWQDRRAYIANMVAATTGARAGEILALTKSSIEGNILFIEKSFDYSNGGDGMKSTKNGEPRRVPLQPEVKELLLELLAENPHKTENPFIFYGLDPDLPVGNINFMSAGLRKTMEQVGINYKERKICFHSWRHYYTARMNDKMAAEELQRVTGHKTKAVFNSYADHVIDKNLIEVGKVGAQVFSNILPFVKTA